MKTTLSAITLAFAAAAFTMPQTVTADLSTPSAEGAEAYIVSPKDGETVKSPVKVIFGLKGMGVAPAGIELENTGHHHLLVDQETLPPAGVPMGNPPLHFGKGQTETMVELEAGTHTLQLILGNHLHVPHNPPVTSQKITITVSD